MGRTPEQMEADEELTASIEKVARLSGVLRHQDMLGDFVVVGATQWMDEEGDIRYAHITLFRNGGIAGYAAIGLLESASAAIKLSGDEE